LLGLLWGEHFYRGRSATYVDQQLSSITQSDAAQDVRSGGGEAVPVLLDLLGDRQSSQRFTAAETLGRIGPPAQAAVPALRSIKEDAEEDKHLRHAAWEALRKITRSEVEPPSSEPSALAWDRLVGPWGLRASYGRKSRRPSSARSG
jgi:hypothetical protein